jgi:hypothetical protein
MARMSALRVVITGSTRAASFAIRGSQLGNAIGATVMVDAPLPVLRRADVVVVVKHASGRLEEALHWCGRPIVWDALDFFGQADCGSRGALIDKARNHAARIGANAVIGATRAMAEDIGSPLSVMHHGWDRGRCATRERIGVVAYEGAEHYLADAREWIERVCEAHGARFVVNPRDYLSADVILATRGPRFDNYATRNWKSGVKLSNAQIAGIPFVGRRECGYLEQASGAELWAEDEFEFSAALTLLADPAERARRGEQMFAAAPRIEAVAAGYRRILESAA